MNNHGVQKWYIDPEKCVLSIAYAHSCDANCIRICPWTKSNARYHDIARLMAKHTPFLDGFLIWLDDFLGYGKRRKHGPYT